MSLTETLCSSYPLNYFVRCQRSMIKSYTTCCEKVKILCYVAETATYFNIMNILWVKTERKVWQKTNLKIIWSTILENLPLHFITHHPTFHSITCNTAQVSTLSSKILTLDISCKLDTLIIKTNCWCFAFSFYASARSI